MSSHGAQNDEGSPFPGFDSFRDDESSPFYRSHLPACGTPEQTVAEITGRLTRVVSGLVMEAARRPLPMGLEEALTEHDEALGWALRTDTEHRTVLPFAELLIARMGASGHRREGGVE
jgi:hypothetical protein